MKTKLILSAALAAALALQGGIADAQEQGGRRGDRGDRGDRGERGERRNPEEFRQRMNERLKENLKATDEEWAVIQPLIEKVTAKQREAQGGRFGGFGGPGGRGGRDGGGQSQSASASASQALRTTLQSDSASPEEIKAKLTAVREARKNAAAEVEKAREELKAVLSVRQEAALVSMGILE